MEENMETQHTLSSIASLMSMFSSQGKNQEVINNSVFGREGIKIFLYVSFFQSFFHNNITSVYIKETK